MKYSRHFVFRLTENVLEFPASFWKNVPKLKTSLCEFVCFVPDQNRSLFIFIFSILRAYFCRIIYLDSVAVVLLLPNSLVVAAVLNICRTPVPLLCNKCFEIRCFVCFFCAFIEGSNKVEIVL